MFSTSNLLENKQLMHITAEVIVVIGIIYYINQKNKALSKDIDKLVQRIEEQEDIIQRHEQLIKKLLETLEKTNKTNIVNQPINTQTKQNVISDANKFNDDDSESYTQTYLDLSSKKEQNVPKTPPSTPTKINTKINKPPQYEDDELSSDEEENVELNIDEILAEELSELNEHQIETDDNVEIIEEKQLGRID
jgi:hypothetical protein